MNILTNACEEMEPLQSNGNMESQPLQPIVISSNILSDPMSSVQFGGNDEILVEFICRLCNKTFYNATALQNHKSLQHDLETSNNEPDFRMPPSFTFPDDNVTDYNSFKFIPMKSGGGPIDTTDDLTPRVLTEDTTYVIVKLANDQEDIEAVKRRRLEGVVKRTQMKPRKQPVDLRGPFTCTFPSAIHPEYQCCQIFFNCCEYSLHYREEHTKRRKAALRCQVCEKRLDRVDVAAPPALQQAIRLTFSCRPCNQSFVDSTKFDDHNRVVHAKTKPHLCTICFKRFTQHGGLQQHMRMHTGIRPFICTFCQKSFTQKAGLDQHLRTHTKVKPFKCVICCKCFSQSIHLRQHMRTHTNIQPFVCSVCGRRFKQTSHLNFHMRSHGTIIENGFEGRYDSEPQGDGDVQMQYISLADLANLQPMGEGETLYFSAELPQSTSPHQAYSFQPNVLPPHVLTL